MIGALTRAVPNGLSVVAASAQAPGEGKGGVIGAGSHICVLA